MPNAAARMASRPEIMGRVLGIVHRVIAEHLVKMSQPNGQP
jgi:hypothetical protein